MNRSIQMTICKGNVGNPKTSIKLDMNVVQDLFDELRGNGPDLFKIVRFGKDNEYKEVQNGLLPYDAEFSEVVYDSLSNFIKSHSKDKEVSGASDFFEAEDEEHCLYAIFIPSSDGVVAVGWYGKDGNLSKAKMMACYAMYAFGLMSISKDKVLYEACYKHLPYHHRDCMDLKTADSFFANQVVAIARS